MLPMQGDMAGAAAVLVAIDIIASRGLQTNVIGVIALAENMPSGTAQRPGDIIRSANGTTIEIVNTDCEGRLVLADALIHAQRLGADMLVDLATLTPPDALGHLVTAAVSNNDTLWSFVDGAATLAGERIHRLPIVPDWESVVTSSVADLRNGFYHEARTITAAMFLAHFVEHPRGSPGYRWFSVERSSRLGRNTERTHRSRH